MIMKSYSSSQVVYKKGGLDRTTLYSCFRPNNSSRAVKKQVHRAPASKISNRLLFALSNEEHKEVPVYGYYLEEAVREMAGIERLRVHGTTFVCRLGKLCTSPISRHKNDNREVKIDLHSIK